MIESTIAYLVLMILDIAFILFLAFAFTKPACSRITSIFFILDAFIPIANIIGLTCLVLVTIAALFHQELKDNKFNRFFFNRFFE